MIRNVNEKTNEFLTQNNQQVGYSNDNFVPSEKASFSTDLFVTVFRSKYFSGSFW